MHVCFVNRYHSGDQHVSRSIISLIIKKLQAIHPTITFSHSHQNDPRLLSDIEGLEFDPEAVHTINENENYARRGDTILINTWYGQKNRRYLNQFGMTLDTLYVALNESCQDLFGFGMADLSSDIRDFFPTINYERFEITSAQNWLSQHPEQKVLVENGLANSGQATNFSMVPVIASLARKHPEKAFILSKREGITLPNVFYTDDIIRKSSGSDLNEISYISSHCSMLVGRASGVFTFALTQENLFEREMKFLAFCNIPSSNGKFFIGSLLENKAQYRSQFIVSGTTNQDNIYRLIDQNIQ